MNIFLYSPKYIENVAAIGRTLEVLGFNKVYLYDSLETLAGKIGKSSKRKLNKISSGSYKYLSFNPIKDPIEFLNNYSYRKIATVLHHESQSLFKFKFKPNDLLMMGNETNGLPENIINHSDYKIKIDQWGKTESLNLGISLGIFLYEYRRQESKNNFNIT